MNPKLKKEFEEFLKLKKLIKKERKAWSSLKIPKWIMQMTKKEIYVHGFESGFNCGMNYVTPKINAPIFEFQEIEDTK